MPANPVGPADLVLIGAPVYSGGARPGTADALAVRDERIVWIGSERDIRADDMIGPSTRVIVVPTGIVAPGFQDAHVHPSHGGLAELQCDLHDLHDAAAYRTAIATYAAAHPDADWVVGSGWSMPAFPGGTPRKELLDEIVPDRPAYFVNRDGHGAWANSVALRMADISATTPDPRDGRIERDPDGEPTGTLHEGAMDIVEALVAPATPDLMEESVRRGQARLHALGITAWQDAWVSGPELDAYLALAGRGELTGRVVGALWWERSRGLEQIDDLLAMRERGVLGRFRATSVKIMQDGVCENHTAAMLASYIGSDGSRTGNAGISMVEPDLLKAAVTRLDAEGFQVHFHAIGDRAVREALDACAAARAANGPRDARHHIAHIQFVHPDDLPRFAELGVVANGQPLWACHEPQMDELTIPFVGEAAAWQYPFASLGGAGATLAFGSDWPVSTPNPLLEMEVAVNRVAPFTRDAAPLLPEERVGLATAFDAFTRGSAYVNGLDAETGSIRVGALADLVVLDRDPFAPGAGPIGDGRALMTLVGGGIVHADASVSW